MAPVPTKPGRSAMHPTNHNHTSSGESRLLIAFLLAALTMLAEAFGGWLSGSLALLADAGHMLVDAFALSLAWAAAHFAQRPADAKRSYGYARLEVLIGYTNALAQFALAIWIIVEAVSRLAAPEPVRSGWMLGIACTGLAINALMLWALGTHDHEDLNAAGARLHIFGDLLGSVGTVIAALAIASRGWIWTDPAVSIVVAVLMLRGAWTLLRRCAHVLLEGTPEGVAVADVVQSVMQHAAVEDVHHVHVWQLAGGRRVATLHARLAEGSDINESLASIQTVLRERFCIAHATIQIEAGKCVLADCRDEPRERQTRTL